MTLAIAIVSFTFWIATSYFALRDHYRAKRFIKGRDIILYADISMLKDMGVDPKEIAENYLQFLKDTLSEKKYEDYIRGLCKVNNVTYKTKRGRVADETIDFLITSLTYDAEESFDNIEYYKERRRKADLLN